MLFSSPVFLQHSIQLHPLRIKISNGTQPRFPHVLKGPSPPFTELGEMAHPRDTVARRCRTPTWVSTIPASWGSSARYRRGRGVEGGWAGAGGQVVGGHFGDVQLVDVFMPAA